MRCKNCGAMINDDEEFCTVCRKAGYITHELDEQISDDNNKSFYGVDIEIASKSFLSIFFIFVMVIPIFNKDFKNLLHIDFNSATALTIGTLALINVIIASFILKRLNTIIYIGIIFLIPLTLYIYDSDWHDSELIIYITLFAAGFLVTEMILGQRNYYLKKGADKKADSLTAGLIAAAALALVILLMSSAISIIRLL